MYWTVWGYWWLVCGRYYLFGDILRQLLCSFFQWNITQWIRCNSSVCLKLTSMNNWNKWLIFCTSYECVIYFSWWMKIYWDNCLSATIKKENFLIFKFHFQYIDVQFFLSKYSKYRVFIPFILFLPNSLNSMHACNCVFRVNMRKRQNAIPCNQNKFHSIIWKTWPSRQIYVIILCT